MIKLTTRKFTYCKIVYYIARLNIIFSSLYVSVVHSSTIETIYVHTKTVWNVQYNS